MPNTIKKRALMQQAARCCGYDTCRLRASVAESGGCRRPRVLPSLLIEIILIACYPLEMDEHGGWGWGWGGGGSHGFLLYRIRYGFFRDDLPDRSMTGSFCLSWPLRERIRLGGDILMRGRGLAPKPPPPPPRGRGSKCQRLLISLSMQEKENTQMS